MKTHVRLILLVGALLCLVQLAVAQQTQTIILQLVDDTEQEVDWPVGHTPELPIYRRNAAGLKERMGKSEVLSIRVADESRPIKGYTRWEVRKVACPSLLLGNNNTETRLIGVRAESEDAQIYGWIGEGTDDRPGDICYGVRLADSDVVYPFVQDNVIALRNLRLVLGSDYPAFVDAVMQYYCKGKRSQQNARQKELRTKPYTLLSRIEEWNNSPSANDE